MDEFLNKLKEFMIKEVTNSHISICGYYHTFKQNIEALNKIVDDISNYKYWFQYDEDNDEGYTNGKILIYLENDEYPYQANHYYKFTLGEDERNWGYCQCTPEDIDYDPVHNCCGNGCDWSAPSISIDKIEYINGFSFDGIERDLWKLEKEWSGEEDKLELKYKQEQVKILEQQIEELEKRKQMIMNK